jgi:hypothetical protein
MCKRMSEMSERIRQDRNLPKGSLIPLGYYCDCEECQKTRPRC